MAQGRAGLIALLVLVGCDADEPSPTCSATVAAQEGTFSATATGKKGESEKDLKKRTVAQACAAYCKAVDGGSRPGCAARCEVDIEAAKMGARVTCSPGGASSGP